MKKLLFLAISLTFIPSVAHAQSCYDLWFERNAIYDRKGFCFKTRLGRETFDNSDCYTDYPQLSRAEQLRVDAIRRQERRMGCRVN